MIVGAWEHHQDKRQSAHLPVVHQAREAY
ncbi:DUF2633 family protein [Escherichia coli]|nr:DUF2633 family protein [Escherichia coli]EFP4246002.1 DUF2633 family protein [Shigella sonnei]EGC2284475.1 DUF2633 family protein [Salmonella enterica subsp. enterica serovar Enteritidis]EGH0058075.1 DUF2633 family protein [Salmonella enterica]NWO39612.1 DUF2633 family protein [Citrobacter freundii]HAU7002936.1 DUF2633 family protein [Salmonella enterica subsp. enterica serovar Tornow]HBW2981095.1 DUF2633 family protein [Klebsiella pneumoniae]